MEMIERYIHAVTQKLPTAQRKDIAKELRGLIEDMLDERVQDRTVTENDVEEVLIELGNPKELAQKYRGTKKFLIGPEYFDSYVTVLKIVMTTMIAVIAGIFVIQIILYPVGILNHFIDLIVHTVTWIPTAFGWTTLGFALAEHFADIKAEDMQFEGEWTPQDLPEIPGKKGKIHRSEAIMGIIFYTVFLLFFTVSTEFFGVWVFNDGFSGTVPFINESMHFIFQVVIIIILGFGVLKEIYKLVQGRWNMRLMTFTIILNVISIAAIVYVMTLPDFWNPNFMQDLAHYHSLAEGSEAYNIINNIWTQATRWIPIFVALGLMWDVVDGLWKVRKVQR